MNGFLLFLMVCSQIIIAFLQFNILKCLDKLTDFQKEDAQVKATTEQLKEAKKRLPKEK